MAFLFPAFAGFLFGYDIGATSGAVSNLGSMLHGAAGFDAGQQSLLTSSSLIGAFAGTFIVFFAGEPLGRRRELMVGATLYMLGTLLTAASPNGGAVVPCIVAGRLLYGLGIAFSMHAAPTYISETAPARVRGLLVSLKEGFICLGILGGFGASAIFTMGSLNLGDGAWRFIWAVPAPVGLFILIGIYCMPASPRWLVLRAAKAAPPSQPLDTSAADAALRRLRAPKLQCCGGGGAAAEAAAADPGYTPAEDDDTDLNFDAEIAAELNQIVDTLAAESGGSCAEVLRNGRALLAGLGLVLLQQVTGQPSVLYYQTAIFEDAGFGDLASSASVIVGAAKLLATLVTVSQVDRFGRRPVLFVGISMMLGALVLLAAAFQFATPVAGAASSSEVHLPGAWPPLVVLALVVYVCGYQVGFGPISWLIISEVFPLRTRSYAISAAVSVNFGVNLLMTATLKFLQDAFDHISPGRGASYLFGLYAVLCAVSLGFVALFVPETKGKSLEQIEAELTR